jgi:NAD(P)H dehydrogenase (quinone)
MAIKIYIIFYSMYGHVYKLAQSIEEGAKSVDGVEVSLFQVPELVPLDVLKKSGAYEIRQTFSHVPVITVDKMPEADALIFGTPTRFGNMCAQMKNFIDQTGPLWAKGALVNKVGSVFTSTATQHGGQETTIYTFLTVLLHHGMIVVGLPYAHKGLTEMNEITGGSPYGASTLAGVDGMRQPSKNECEIAKFQGMHVAEVTKKLKC